MPKNEPTVLGWHRWDDAQKLPTAKRAGVYLLAHFKKPPSVVNPSDGNIVYIGETCGQTLRQRWRQFARSAFLTKAAHSGGTTYSDTFGGGERERLYVAFACPGDKEP